MGTRWLTILLVAGLAAGAGYYFWQHRGTPKLDIQTATAVRGEVRRIVSTSGTVRALGTVEIGSQLSGNNGEVNADFSSEVKKGDVIARIEPSTFESRVREEEAGLAIAKANVSLQEATVARAEANLRKAEIDLHRADELVRKGVGAQAPLDAAKAAHESAIAELSIARAQVENAKATVEQRQAALVLMAQEMGDRHQALPAHCIGGAGKQHLDLHVIELGRLFSKVAAGLEMKIL